MIQNFKEKGSGEGGGGFYPLGLPQIRPRAVTKSLLMILPYLFD